MATSKELREKRAKLTERIQKFADLVTERALTAEEKGQYDAVNADYDQLSAQIEIVERAEKVAADQQVRTPEAPRPGRHDVRHEPPSPTPPPAPTGPTVEDRNLAYHAWFLNTSQRTRANITPEHVAAAQRVGLNLASEDLEFRLFDSTRYDALRHPERRALSAQIPTAGEFTVAESFVSRLEQAMLWFGGCRQVATVMRTAGGEEMLWPTTNDTGNTGAQINENVAVSEQDVTFGAVLFHAYMYTSKMCKVPFTLLQDSSFNIATVLGDLLGERLGRIGNTHFTTGDGAGKPLGIVTAATTFSAAAAASISFDDIFGLIHSVDIAYRSGPGAGFMMADSTAKALRLLKDGNGRYLWVDSVQAGQASTILGYGVTINNDMAAIATGNKTVLFGALAKYMIRDVGSVRLRRLTERYAELDQEAFVAFARFDGNLLNAGVAPVKVLTHP